MSGYRYVSFVVVGEGIGNIGIGMYTVYVFIFQDIIGQASLADVGIEMFKIFFFFFQDIIERAIVDIHAGRFVIEPGTYINQMPYPCYRSDQ